MSGCITSDAKECCGNKAFIPSCWHRWNVRFCPLDRTRSQKIKALLRLAGVGSPFLPLPWESLCPAGRGARPSPALRWQGQLGRMDPGSGKALRDSSWLWSLSPGCPWAQRGRTGPCTAHPARDCPRGVVTSPLTRVPVSCSL